MKSIWKFPLKGDWEVIEMPEGAQILDLQVQNGEPVMWAVVDPSRPKVKRSFAIYGTGWNLSDKLLKRYIGTFQQGPLVWHVFEEEGS